jgi:hypothetical protein
MKGYLEPYLITCHSIPPKSKIIKKIQAQNISMGKIKPS